MTVPAPAAAPAASSTGRGIAMALCAFAMFTVMDSCVKLLGGHWHVFQVMACNAFFALILVTTVGLWRGGPARLRSKRLKLHVLRWTISLVGTVAMFAAYPHVPLADAYGVLFTMPLFLTALSVPLLGEQVGWRRWSAVIVGFIGVMIMLRPGEHGVSPWLFSVLFAAVAHALNMIMIRKLGAVDPPEAVSFWGNLWTCLACGATLPWLGVWPSAGEMGLGMLAGSIAGAGFLLLVTAYQIAPASIIAPFQYSQLIYGVTVGYFLFAEVPRWNTALGAAVIVGSGLYILHRETRRAAPAVAKALPPQAAT